MANSGGGTTGTSPGSSKGLLKALGIGILILVLAQLAWLYYQNKGAVSRSSPELIGAARDSKQVGIYLNQGDPIKWVSIPRKICYEVNLAKDGECVTSYINSEGNPRQLCQGKHEHIDTVVFRLGLSSSHKTVAAVDLFPCE